MRLPGVLVANVLVLLAAPLQAPAQTPSPAALPDSIQGLLTELGTLRQRFENAQRKALDADVRLSESQRQVRELVNATALRLRPDTEELFALLPRIQSAASAAEQAGEVERLEALLADARRIQTALEDAQAQALEQPEVAIQIQAFERRMVDGMKAFEPDIEAVLERIQDLAARLQSWVGKPS
jgi:hypothetical protein